MYRVYVGLYLLPSTMDLAWAEWDATKDMKVLHSMMKLVAFIASWYMLVKICDNPPSKVWQGVM